MKKSFLILFACIICIIGFQAFTYHHPTYQNLKILPQDISEHDLDSVMKHFCLSLGVKSNFCHVRNEQERKMDFPSDNKPEKNIARKMMMMAITLNKNYFKGMDMDMDHDHDANAADHDMPPMSMDVKIDTTKSPDDYKYMLQTVTCYTCHRGDAHPESKAPLPPPPPGQGQPNGNNPNGNGGK